MKRARICLTVTLFILAIISVAITARVYGEKNESEFVTNLIPDIAKQNLESAGIHNLVIYQTGNKLDILNGLERSDEIEIAFKCTDEKYDNLNGHPADGLGYTEDFDDTTYRKPVLGYSLTSKRGTIVDLKSGDIINIETKVRKLGDNEAIVFNIPLGIKYDITIK